MRQTVTGRGCSVGKDLSAARTFELRPQGDEELEEGHPRQRGYKDAEAGKPWPAQEQRDGGRRVVRRMIWGEFREEAGARSCRALEAAVRAWILF